MWMSWRCLEVVAALEVVDTLCQGLGGVGIIVVLAVVLVVCARCGCGLVSGGCGLFGAWHLVVATGRVSVDIEVARLVDIESFRIISIQHLHAGVGEIFMVGQKIFLRTIHRVRFVDACTESRFVVKEAAIFFLLLRG